MSHLIYGWHHKASVVPRARQQLSASNKPDVDNTKMHFLYVSRICWFTPLCRVCESDWFTWSSACLQMSGISCMLVVVCSRSGTVPSLISRQSTVGGRQMVEWTAVLSVSFCHQVSPLAAYSLCMSLIVSLSLSVSLSICLSLRYPSLSPPISLFLSLSFCLSVSLSLCPLSFSSLSTLFLSHSTFLSVSLSIPLPPPLSYSPFVHLSPPPYFCLSPSLPTLHSDFIVNLLLPTFSWSSLPPLSPSLLHLSAVFLCSSYFKSFPEPWNVLSPSHPKCVSIPCPCHLFSSGCLLQWMCPLSLSLPVVRVLHRLLSAMSCHTHSAVCVILPHSHRHFHQPGHRRTKRGGTSDRCPVPQHVYKYNNRNR